MVLTSTSTRTGPTFISSTTAWYLGYMWTKANFIVASQARQNWPPLHSGRVSGDVVDVDSLSSDDFCWAQEVEEIVMYRKVINNKMVKYTGEKTRMGW